MMTAQAEPRTREQMLDLWMQQGMPAEERAFFEANPELIDHPQLTAAAAKPYSRAINSEAKHTRTATKEIFYRHLRHLHAEGAAQSPPFFQPPAPPAHSMPRPAGFTSAPVTRGEVGGGYREPNNPSRIKLSPDELQIAQASGISKRATAMSVKLSKPAIEYTDDHGDSEEAVMIHAEAVELIDDPDVWRGLAKGLVAPMWNLETLSDKYGVDPRSTRAMMVAFLHASPQARQ